MLEYEELLSSPVLFSDRVRFPGRDESYLDGNCRVSGSEALAKAHFFRCADACPRRRLPPEKTSVDTGWLKSLAYE